MFLERISFPVKIKGIASILAGISSDFFMQQGIEHRGISLSVPGEDEIHMAQRSKVHNDYPDGYANMKSLISKIYHLDGGKTLIKNREEVISCVTVKAQNPLNIRVYDRVALERLAGHSLSSPSEFYIQAYFQQPSKGVMEAYSDYLRTALNAQVIENIKSNNS